MVEEYAINKIAQEDGSAVQCSAVVARNTLFREKKLYENKLIKALRNWEAPNIYFVCLVKEAVLLLKDDKNSIQ